MVSLHRLRQRTRLQAANMRSCFQFDLCPLCGIKGEHPHVLYKEKYHPTDVMWAVQEKSSMAEKLQYTFSGFEFRPCIAERVLRPDDTHGEYHVRISFA